MRQSYNDSGFIIRDNVFYGVSLGYDYCAEHEWGIKEMQHILEIPELKRKKFLGYTYFSTAGIKSRMINVKNPENFFVYKEDGNFTYLFMGRKYFWEKTCDDKTPDYCLKKDNLKWIEKQNKSEEKKKDLIITAWDSREFGILVKGSQERGYIKELYDALLNGKCAITFMNFRGKNPFSNSSLSILITDKLPKEALDQMIEADTESLDLADLERKFNLKEKLNKTGKFRDYHLHYCGPKFLAYNKPKEILKKEQERYKTKYNVIYWLNSSDVFGWFTIEQLMELINDKHLSIEEFKKKHG